MNIIKNNNKKGFTLIELLMVISIITLLSSMLFSYVGTARAKSRDAVRLSDMKQIGTAANLYYEDNGVLPSSIGALVPNYLSSIPTDPKTGSAYSFTKDNPIKTIVISGNYESDNQIVAIAVGEVDTTTLCNTTFATSTGCSGTTISGHIVGVTSRRRSGGSGGSGGSEVVPCGGPTVAACWSDEVSKVWDTTNFIDTAVTETTDTYDGKANTAILHDLGPAYEAADYCYTLEEDDVPQGTWYLPSYAELWIGRNAPDVGGSGGFPSFGYFSSTEYSPVPWSYVQVLYNSRFTPLGGNHKASQYSVRCLRQ